MAHVLFTAVSPESEFGQLPRDSVHSVPHYHAGEVTSSGQNRTAPVPGRSSTLLPGAVLMHFTTFLIEFQDFKILSLFHSFELFEETFGVVSIE
jgi:hypothetical protein